MNRIRLLTLSICLAFAGLALTTAPQSVSAADDKKWVTIKGQVKWPEKTPIPEPVAIDVKGEVKCEIKGKIFDDKLIINSKNKGLKNIFVHLRPNNKDRDAKFTAAEIHPDLQKPKPVIHEADQPCCLFIPRNLALRSGDFIKFKNTSAIGHNVKLEGDMPSPSFNKTIAPDGFYQDPAPYMAQFTQIEYGCNSHPWMKGKIMIFDHPYFALTDDDGKFEIKNAPVGAYRIVYQGDSFHKGREGNRGWEITVKDGGKGTMELEPLEFVIPPETK